MPEIYIISQADIVQYHPMATIPQNRLDPFILKAQELDLKPVLNDSLYYDFLTKFKNSDDPMFAAYQNLLNGCTYQYSGQTINFPGLKPMLSAFTMARFLPANQANITAYGVVTKTNPQSEPMPSSSITYMVNNLRSEAVAYQNQVEQFLLQNQNTYPLYGSFPSSVQSRTGVKFNNSARGAGAGRYRGWWNGNYYP